MDTSDTAEVASVVPFTVDAVLAMLMSFGFDVDTGQIAPVMDDGVEVPSTFEVRFGLPTWNGDPSSYGSYCTMSWVLDGRYADPFAASEGWWFGLEGLDLQSGSTDCENPNEQVDLLPAFSAFEWRFAFGGDLDPEVEGLVAPGLANPDDLATLFGGVIEVPDLVAGELPLYNQALAIDGERNVIYDPLDLTQPIDAVDVPTADGLATAWYAVGVPWLVTLEINGETTDVDEASN